MSHDKSLSGSRCEVAPFAQESLLIDAIGEMSGEHLVCTSAGLAQFAGAAAQALPQARVTCTYLDRYHADLASNYWSEQPANLRIVCAADLPNAAADLVALPLSASGEAELARELIQEGHQRLRLGGKMYASSNNPHDTWLGGQINRLFPRVETRSLAKGILYVAAKTEPMRKLKDFSCEFAFRDRGRLIRVGSRPGVFSHRRVDVGARKLIDEMQIEPGMRVLDIGCGSGVVALAAACRALDVTVHAVDSNARATQCTQYGAGLNGLDNVTVELNAAGGYVGAGEYDLALANPPYYAGFRIAQHFLTAGRAALRNGGRILVVTKHPDWYRQNMTRWYDGIRIHERKAYYLVEGIRPTGAPHE